MVPKGKWVGFLAVVAVVGLLLAGACGPDASAPGFSAQTGSASTEDLTVAPEFTLESLDGEPVRLSDSAGQVRLVDFWATWCAPCREEIPMLNELQANYGERGFRVLAISDPDDELNLIREFVDEHEVEYLNLVGTAEVTQSYQVPGLPTAYLVDGEGRVIEKFFGAKPRRVLEKKIEALLAEAPTT
jgi:thiol-disulfide isomerase/thioredoxin